MSKVGVPVPPTLPAPLRAYLHSLATRPLLTKMITGGCLSFIQELLSSRLSRSPHPAPSARLPPALAQLLARAYVGPKALKLALYGFLISAPLGHFMVLAVTRAFAGVSGLKARVGQLLMSNLVVAPIQVSAYLSSMALINGAPNPKAVLAAVKSGFPTAMQMTWITSPVAIVIAQQFLPPELWAVFFNLVNFCLGTYFGVMIKRAQLAKAKKGKGKPDAPAAAPAPAPEPEKEAEKKDI